MKDYRILGGPLARTVASDALSQMPDTKQKNQSGSSDECIRSDLPFDRSATRTYEAVEARNTLDPLCA